MSELHSQLRSQRRDSLQRLEEAQRWATRCSWLEGWLASLAGQAGKLQDDYASALDWCRQATADAKWWWQQGGQGHWQLFWQGFARQTSADDLCGLALLAFSAGGLLDDLAKVSAMAQGAWVNRQRAGSGWH